MVETCQQTISSSERNDVIHLQAQFVASVSTLGPRVLLYLRGLEATMLASPLGPSPRCSPRGSPQMIALELTRMLVRAIRRTTGRKRLTAAR